MDHHQLDLNTRKLKVIGNICAVHLKAKDWASTKRAADVGLRHMQKAELKDGEAEAKFLYRKGVANLERGFSEDAYEALRKADAANPGDKQVRQALKAATDAQRRDKREAKLVWRDKLLTEQEKACQ